MTPVLFFLHFAPLLLPPSHARRHCHAENENEDVDFYRTNQDRRPLCDSSQLATFLAKMEAFRPEDVVNIATKDVVCVVCERVKKRLEVVDEVLEKCRPPTQPDLYYQMIEGLHTLYQKLCLDCGYRTCFERYENCYVELHDELDECAGAADWQQCENNTLRCRMYAEIADCYYIKVATLCGKAAARLLKQLLRLTLDEIVKADCCRNLNEDPYVQEAMPEEQAEECCAGYKMAECWRLVLFVLLIALIIR